MFLHLDYYEYNAWFRKRKDLIEKYCTSSTGWNPGHHAYILNEYLKREDKWWRLSPRVRGVAEWNGL